MVSIAKAVLFGFLLWLIAFVVAFAIFPIRESWRALFESIMPVVVTVAAMGLGLRYFRGVSGKFVREGVMLGVLWLAINVIIDLPLMLTGPISMTLVEYSADIALTYVIIPTVTVGIGLARAQNERAEVVDTA